MPFLAFLLALAAAPAAWALKAELGPFIGTYVGTAQVFGEDGEVEGERDMTIQIEEGPKDGFVITWVNVSLVDGRRGRAGGRAARRHRHLRAGGSRRSLY